MAGITHKTKDGRDELRADEIASDGEEDSKEEEIQSDNSTSSQGLAIGRRTDGNSSSVGQGLQSNPGEEYGQQQTLQNNK